MPELPEVETVKNAIEDKLLGSTIESSNLYRQKIRFDIPKHFNESLLKATIDKITRRSKYILLHLDNGFIVLIHLGMSGRVFIHNKNEPEIARQKHDHWVCDFNNGYRLAFNDPRRFGVLNILKEETITTHPLLAKIGPEPFSPEFSVDYLYESLKKKSGVIKTTLLNQQLVAGLGNIYVCEALFRSNISPLRKSNQIKKKEVPLLHKEIINTLQEAIDKGGSTLKDFHHTDGSLGYFQHNFKVYDREGKPCPNCSDCKVVRITQSGRSTYYCPKTQI